MKEKVYLTILFDYYEELLSEKDKECFKLYYFDNLSLSEISENLNISRNAIHKRIKKIEDELTDFEEKLKLYEKEQKILNLIKDENLKNKIRNILNQ